MEAKELVDVKMEISELLGLQEAMAAMLLPSDFTQDKAGSHFREVIRILNLEPLLTWAKGGQTEPHDAVASVVGSAAGNGCRAHGQRTIVTDEEMAFHDGFQWKKCGEKEISNSEYTRNYYGCNTEGNSCQVRKQMQQVGPKNRSWYVVKYFGEHTCKNLPFAAAASGPLRSKKPRRSNRESDDSGITSEFQREQPSMNGSSEIMSVSQSDCTSASVNCAEPSLGAFLEGDWDWDHLLEFSGGKLGPSDIQCLDDIGRDGGLGGNVLW